MEKKDVILQFIRKEFYGLEKVCCQPIRDCMTVAAFRLGLQENLHALDELLQEDYVLYHHGYTPTELRRMFTYAKLPAFVDEDDLYTLAEQVVEPAEDGLRVGIKRRKLKKRGIKKLKVVYSKKRKQRI
ncbi:MAG: hypothetical protein MR304_02705 [Eubacterium sp.]|nr:hypothetical protein [Eubacterium sp.]